MIIFIIVKGEFLCVQKKYVNFASKNLYQNQVTNKDFVHGIVCILGENLTGIEIESVGVETNLV